jgi:hypothetical protein
MTVSGKWCLRSGNHFIVNEVIILVIIIFCEVVRQPFCYYVFENGKRNFSVICNCTSCICHPQYIPARKEGTACCFLAKEVYSSSNSTGQLNAEPAGEVCGVSVTVYNAEV